MKRTIAFILMITLISLTLLSCGEDKPLTAKALNGRYTHPNDNGLEIDSFTISLVSDGTFSYHTSLLSSYLGIGKYTIDGNVITLTEEYTPISSDKTISDITLLKKFKFKYENGKLIFLANESDSFMFATLPDGAVFEYTGDPAVIKQ
ncbi:MAG: hypothetical protein IJR55_05205 [Clostridia bacterium]|nr:hypothetical protein [Clostridia bacterium]